MEERTVVVVQEPSGNILKVMIVPTAHINKRDQKDLKALGEKYNQQVQLFPIKGWTGIEAAKWDIREMNGDT